MKGAVDGSLPGASVMKVTCLPISDGWDLAGPQEGDGGRLGLAAPGREA